MARAKAKGRSGSAAKRRPESTQDAIALLKADHRQVEEWFAQFEKARTDDRKLELATDICNALTVHTTIEEEIFYPAARGAIRDEDLMDEADVEHEGAKNLIAQLRSASPGGDHYDAKVTVLGENIKHHVKEEHGEMFPKIKKSKLDTKALGAQMMARKSELKAAAGRR